MHSYRTLTDRPRTGITIGLTLLSLVTAIAATGYAAATAIAGGERKNEAPFTRPIGAPVPTHAAPASPMKAGTGEPKNVWPFAESRSSHIPVGEIPTTTSDRPLRSEPKNELPFTRPIPDWSRVASEWR